jgi:hypothetical protein
MRSAVAPSKIVALVSTVITVQLPQPRKAEELASSPRRYSAVAARIARALKRTAGMANDRAGVSHHGLERRDELDRMSRRAQLRIECRIEPILKFQRRTLVAPSATE